MAKNNVIATLLPGTTLFLGMDTYANGRSMIYIGCNVAIASDYNPGSSTIYSMPLIMALASLYCGLTIKESVKAANSFVRSKSLEYGIVPPIFETKDFHIHVPEGATPKDGPSAGAAMCTAVTSVLSKIPVRSDVAMTGEITLRGEVLKIGGLKEKLLAAHRGGIKMVLIPEGNVRDLKEIPDNIKKELDIRPVKWIDDVLNLVLTRQPIPWENEEESSDKISPKKNRSQKKTIGTH